MQIKIINCKLKIDYDKYLFKKHKKYLKIKIQFIMINV